MNALSPALISDLNATLREVESNAEVAALRLCRDQLAGCPRHRLVQWRKFEVSVIGRINETFPSTCSTVPRSQFDKICLLVLSKF